MDVRSLSLAAGIALVTAAATALGARSYGVDVSDWQGSINWSAVRNAGKDFAFIRSTRGGTTGTYNQSTRVGTLSHRYDDLRFTFNITQARSVGIFAGPYHFSRPDLPANTGLDEANHMLEIAGAYMKPGHLRPVLDLEAGDQRSTTDLTNWALEFANRIYEVKGVYPIVYVNSYYANTQVDSRLAALDLWIARWPTNPNPEGNPPGTSTYPNVYGVWNPTYPNTPNPAPWDFWQYSSTGSVSGVSGNVDLNVANGDIERVKDFLVPALWVNDADGQWTSAANWNASPSLPGPNDRVILDRPAGLLNITLASGLHSIRSLETREALDVAGGTLNIQQYARFLSASQLTGGVVNTGSATNSAGLSIAGGRLNAPLFTNAATFALASGALDAGTFANASVLDQSGGTLSADAVTGTGTINLSGGLLETPSLLQSRLLISGDGVARLSGQGLSRVQVLSVTDAGQLDIGGGTFVVDYSGVPPLNSIGALIANLRVLSSTSETGEAVGFGLSADLGILNVDGIAIDNTSIVLRSTLDGDADLDGDVDIADLGRLASAWQTASHWAYGDFNHDGFIDISDLGGLAGNWQQGVTGPTGPDMNFAAALAQVALPAIPEPAGLAAVALAIAAGTLRSRRR